jgi:beta-glucosidase-like glycosyl hydrolase
MKIWIKAQARKLISFIIFSLATGLIAWLSLSHETELQREDRIIESYVNQIAIEDAVGQILMVGLTADINTIAESESTNSELVDIGIGAAIVSSKNYYDDHNLSDEDYLQKVISFNNLVQEKTLKSKLKLPLIVAADFEGYGYAPIKRGLTLPPSALSMGATLNGELVEKIGGHIGFQLESLGIQAMLGPVLDAYNLEQGGGVVLQDRSFAGVPKGVTTTTSHYIKGLNRSNILLIAKHFPSHGSVEVNPHELSIPVYEASNEQMESDLLPFEYFNKHIDGIMTSHVKVEHLDNQMATFSKRLVGGFLKKDMLNEQLIITDDLSEMGAIKKYMSESNKSYSDVAIEAFDAGHDMLLFAHCNEKQAKDGGRKGQFTFTELVKVKASLASHIKDVKGRQEQFKNSLKKIIKAKLKLAKKKKSWSIDHLIDAHVKDAAYLTDSRGRTVKDDSTIKFFESFGKTYSTETTADFGQSLVREAINGAAQNIHAEWPQKMLSDLNADAYIVFAVYDEGYNQFKSNFATKFANAIFLKIPQDKGGAAFKNIEKEIKSKILHADLLVYTAHDKSDADLLKRVMAENKEHLQKTIILCHNSPGILDNTLLNSVPTIALYTKHPISFDVDGDILSARFTPRNINNAPVSIGENGEFYNVANTKWIEMANLALVEDLQVIEDERTCARRMQQKYILIEKDNEVMFRWFVITLIMMLAIHYLHKRGKRAGEKNQWIVILADTKLYVVTQATVLIVSIYFALFGTSQLIHSIRDGIEVRNGLEHIVGVSK